jgi:hypothetical protein
MSEEYLSRFAVILLKNNGHLGEFEVDVMDFGFAQRLKARFEELGCTAQLSDYTAVVTIKCSPDTLKQVLAAHQTIGAHQLL